MIIFSLHIGHKFRFHGMTTRRESFDGLRNLSRVSESRVSCQKTCSLILNSYLLKNNHLKVVPDTNQGMKK